jgi:hypothetical protein
MKYIVPILAAVLLLIDAALLISIVVELVLP